MKEEELKKQYQGLKDEYYKYEDLYKRLKIILQKMENDNPYKVMEKEIEIVMDTMENLSEDMDWFLDRMNEVDDEKN